MATMADDIAYGHEMCAGFQRVFEEAGGKVVQKMCPPLTVPDYAHLHRAAQDATSDALFIGFAGLERLPLTCASSTNTACAASCTWSAA